jgi:hypoxanthine phosphoribosyltransferase
MQEELDNIYYTESDINLRVSELGEEITEAYKDYDEVTVISIINGALYFTVDILRNINIPIRLDCIRVSSYRNKSQPDKKPEIIDTIRLDLKDRHVLLIDDILDTGHTISLVYNHLKQRHPSSLLTCILLDKDRPRAVPFKADFIGFKIPDKFVVGYGLDYAERYRNLPCIGSLKTELLNPI